MEEQREVKITNWFIKTFWQNKINLILLLIIMATLLVRIFFFMATTDAGQTSWWDSAEYLSQGTHYATGVPYAENPQRPPAFQYMIAGFIMLGLNESWIIFLLSLIPSVLLVWLVFILGRSIFNEKVGLIAAAFLSFSWNLIFWSNRAQPDFLTICFQVLAIYYFWEMLKIKEKDTSISVTKQAILAGIYSALAFYFKISAILVPLAFFLYILIKDKLKIFIKKEYWIYGFSLFASMVPYFIWAYYKFHSILAFSTGYSNNIIIDLPFGWSAITYFRVFGLNAMFLVFIIGFILILKSLLYIDLIIKKNELDVRVFLLTLIITLVCFFIFYIRQIEDRWILLLLPIMAIVCGIVLDKLYTWISDHDGWKWIGIILIGGLLLYSSYEQFNYGNAIIYNKMTSYGDVKLAGEWMKANTQANDIVLSISYPQTVYYSQRHVETYSIWNETYLTQYIDSNHPKFLTISIYEPHPSWIYAYIENNTRFVPVMGYFQDVQKTKPSLIIYKID